MTVTTIPTAGIADNSITTAKTAFNDIPFRNRIINGDISVSQRGTSFSNVASGDYTIDRWKMNYRAIGNADISQVDNKTYKSLKVLNSNGSTQEIVMGTRIEDIAQFHNDSFILSFYAKASTSCTLDTRVFENYGAGGSTTVNRVVAGSQNKTITTSRQRFTITFTASDMSSKTIGTSNFLEINFSVSLASGANWEYDSVQLEQGTSASDFEFIPFDVNLQRCQRYLQRYGNTNRQGICVGTLQPQSNLHCSMTYVNTMRASPSQSFSNLQMTDRYSADYTVSSIGNFIAATDCCYVRFTTSTNAPNENRVCYNIVVTGGSDGFFELDAEL
jgi:hypothetical protein|tara:strand:+ start:516 stop:1508 length:993 start_codon:yes stop_codon:yes gene_type:complete